MYINGAYNMPSTGLVYSIQWAHMKSILHGSVHNLYK